MWEMKLYEHKLNISKSIKKIYCCKGYVYGFTGQSVIVHDECFNELHRVTGLKHVYEGVVSKDGKMMLVPSTDKFFYIISLLDFSVKKYIIAGKQYSSLELEAGCCWDFEENKCVIPVFNIETKDSELRIYDSRTSLFKKHIFHQCRIIFIRRIDNRYLIISQRLGFSDEEHPLSDLAITWFDFNAPDDIITRDIDFFEDALLGIKVIKEEKKILLFGDNIVRCCNYDGQQKEPIFFPWYKKYLTKYLERINDVYIDADIIYIGTTHKLIAIDSKTNEITSIDIVHGVQKIHFQSGCVFVETFSGLRKFSLYN